MAAWSQTSRALSRHPRWLLLIAAILAVLVNCYPIIFCGRSFVSPNNGAPNNGGNSLLYDTTPTLPGYTDEHIADLHGADTGAIMWHDIPNAFVEARGLFREGALPFWNRCKNAGDPMLPQAISMFGDPLHFIVLAGGASAWAWDLKFLAAKALFCFGCGWLVLLLTRHLGLSLVFTAAAAYCGLFNFVPNHPGFFVFCYTPWILLSAIRALMGTGSRRFAWGLIWLVGDTGCFNAGHVEAAVVCIGGLNVIGLVYALLEARNGRARWRAVAVMAAMTALFLGLNAPVWLPFLSYLPASFNLHTDVVIEQFPLHLLAGLGDDCFYHAVQEGPLAEGPGGTMFALFGTLFALASWRELRSERFFTVSLAAFTVWAGFIFGYIPAAWVEHLPLIRRIGHIRADFSYLAVFHLLIGSAYGSLALIRTVDLQLVWRRWLASAIGLGLIELIFFWFTRAVEKPSEFYLYVAAVTACVLSAPLLYLWLRGAAGARRIAGGLALGLLLFAPHARFGLYTFGPEGWVIQPGVRVPLDAPSEAVEYMRRNAKEPFRATGLAWDLYGGYGAVYGLEDIKGVSALMNPYYNELCTHYPGIERDSYLLELDDPAAAKNLLSMLNVRYLAMNRADPPPDDLPYRLAGKYDLTVFENDAVWPRAFFASRLREYGGVDDFVSALGKDGGTPFVAMSRADLAGHPELLMLVAGSGSSTIQPASGYRLETNVTSFEIDAPASGVALLAETYVAQGFTVEVNGASHPVLRLNHALKGVYLDRPGHYRVTFRYRPPHWGLAMALFYASLAVIGMAALAGVPSFWALSLKRSRLLEIPCR